MPTNILETVGMAYRITEIEFPSSQATSPTTEDGTQTEL